MTDLSPYPPTTPPTLPAPRRPPRSLWKPIGISLLVTLVLAFSTCAGGLRIGKSPDGLGAFLLISGLIFTGLFLVTLTIAVIYFFIWLIQKARIR